MVRPSTVSEKWESKGSWVLSSSCCRSLTGRRKKTAAERRSVNWSEAQVAFKSNVIRSNGTRSLTGSMCVWYNSINSYRCKDAPLFWNSNSMPVSPFPVQIKMTSSRDKDRDDDNEDINYWPRGNKSAVRKHLWYLQISYCSAKNRLNVVLLWNLFF